MSFQSLHSGAGATTEEVSICPEFYTTDIKKFSDLKTAASLISFDSVVEELRKDDGRDKFIRDTRFNQSWNHIQGEEREIIIEILKRYCAAEYSGFILYKELSHQLRESSTVLSEGFSLMARDEARHASFLSQSLSDFALKPNLDFLNKKGRKYSFLPFSWFMISTYLSEKISSCYYITIFEHLKSHPEYSKYPLFDFYNFWSADEARHGDFWGAIIKAQTQVSNKIVAKLTCKLYLLLVFNMYYLSRDKNDRIFALFGLETCKYIVSTTQKINHSVGEHLPVVLDLEGSHFFDKLESCHSHLTNIKKINRSDQHILSKSLKKLPSYLALIKTFSSLLFIKSMNPHAKTIS